MCKVIQFLIVGAVVVSNAQSPLITANWEADTGNRWTVPIGGGFGRIFKIGHQPINANIAAYYNVVTPDDTGANWQLRAEWTFLFPTH